MALFGIQAVGIFGSLLALILGVMILLMPKLLRFLLGIYFALIGIIGLVASI